MGVVGVDTKGAPVLGAGQALGWVLRSHQARLPPGAEAPSPTRDPLLVEAT